MIRPDLYHLLVPSGTYFMDCNICPFRGNFGCTNIKSGREVNPFYFKTCPTKMSMLVYNRALIPTAKGNRRITL